MYPKVDGSYLVLELTNLCNLACVHCAVSESNHLHHAQTGFIDVDTVDALIQNMVQHQIQFDVLILFWLGEPLLHPKFSKIYRMFLRASVQHNIFASIEVHTNAILLSESIQRVLLNNADLPQRIHCTIDAFTDETYFAVKGRNQLRESMTNTVELIQKKTTLNCLHPQIVLQYIVGSNNVHEVQPFLRYWEDIFLNSDKNFFVSAGQIPNGIEDGIFFRQLDCSSSEQQEIENALFQTEMNNLGVPFPQSQPQSNVESKQSTPCSGFWKSPVIDWQGNLTMCTRDNELFNSLGNIQQTPFDELWWGKRQTRNRQRVSNGDYGELSLCQTCFIPQSCNHSDISELEIKLYAEQV